MLSSGATLVETISELCTRIQYGHVLLAKCYAGVLPKIYDVVAG